MSDAFRGSVKTTGALLALVWFVAYLVRYRYFIGLGGLEPDYMEWAKTNYFGGITGSYLKSANAIMALDWSLSGRSYPPVYPFMLAVLKWLSGNDLQVARQFQMALDASGIVLVFAICRRLDCLTMVSILAALGYAVAPWWAWGASPIIADSVIPLLVLVFLLAALVARDSNSIKAWLFLGLAGSALTLTRSEFGLLFSVILILAVFGAQGRVLAASTAGLFAFWVPFLCVSIINYITFGFFFSATNATFYAFYSGLGMIPNSFGYVVSDVIAGERLSQFGIHYHTAEAEAFWKNIYLNAWKDHPYHILKTILHRFDIIAFGQEHTNYSSLFVPVFHYGFFLTGLAVAWLIHRRRFYDILIVAGPMLFALCTLGIIYVEPRYVRYASLTYLFGSAVVVSALLTSANRLLFSRWPRISPGVSAVTFFITFVALVELGLFRPDAEARKFLKSAFPQDFSAVPLQPVADLAPAVEGAFIYRDDQKFIVESSKTVLGYQAWSKIDTSYTTLLLLKYDVEAAPDSQWFVGLLSEDAQNFYGQYAISSKTRIIETKIVDTKADNFLRIVFTGIKPETKLFINRLETARICGYYQFSLMWLLFPDAGNVPLFKIEPCNTTRQSP